MCMRKAASFESLSSHVKKKKKIFLFLFQNNFPFVRILVALSGGDHFLCWESILALVPLCWMESEWADGFLGNHRAACKLTLDSGVLAVRAHFKVKRQPVLASLSLYCWSWLLFRDSCARSSWTVCKAICSLVFNIPLAVSKLDFKAIIMKKLHWKWILF